MTNPRKKAQKANIDSLRWHQKISYYLIELICGFCLAKLLRIVLGGDFSMPYFIIFILCFVSIYLLSVDFSKALIERIGKLKVGFRSILKVFKHSVIPTVTFVAGFVLELNSENQHLTINLLLEILIGFIVIILFSMRWIYAFKLIGGQN